jgi:membrane fusion protein, multidrug efflux system
MTAPSRNATPAAETTPHLVTPPNDASPAAVPETPRRKRGGRRLLIAALPLALAVTGGYFWVTGGRYIETEDAYVQQNRVNVVPQVNGRIAEVLVRENEVVAAGQPLFRLEDDEYRNALEAAQAGLGSARLDVERLKAAYSQAEAELRNARDTLATTQTQDDRQQSLRASGVVSQSAADDSALKLQLAKGALSKAESAVLSARAALAGDPTIATDKHPEVLQALAALHAAELDLSRTTVAAPDAGIVSQTDRLQAGQYVTPAVPVLNLVATAETWIEANYKETELTHMQPGQRVTVRIDTYGDHPLTGVVGSIGAGTGSEFALIPAQNASGNWVKVVQRVPVRIKLDDGQQVPALRAGMSATVEVDSGHARGLPRVLTAALSAVGLGSNTAVAASGAE